MISAARMPRVRLHLDLPWAHTATLAPCKMCYQPHSSRCDQVVEAVGGSSVGSGWADEFRSRAAPPSGWADEFTQHQAAQAAGQPPQPYQQQQQAGGRAGEWADDFARGLQQRQQAGGWTEDWARDFASGLQLGEGPEAAAAAAAMMEGAWADGMQAGPAGSGWANEFQQQDGEEKVFEVRLEGQRRGEG